MAISSSLVLTLLTLHCYYLLNAEFAKNETHQCDLKNCTETTSCIKTYHELDSYIRGNSCLREKLTSGFFMTDSKTPSDFVIINYKFQVSYSTVNGVSNSTRNDTVKCSTHERKYIWSENFLYVFGPDVVFWFTLTVVEVREGSVSIELPCLCHDVYNSLLSRLTYMSKVYAMMDYGGQSLQFISNHYFEAKNLYHGIYPSITNLCYTITQFSLIGVPFISYLVIKFIHPKISHGVKKFSDFLRTGKGFSQKAIRLNLIFSFVIINLIFTCLLIVAHIFSAIEFINYGSEILNNADHNLPYVHSAFSSFAILTMLSIALGYCICKMDMCFTIATLFSVNIIYLLSYFGPFMFLAFVNVPLLIITFIITTVVIYVIWCFLFTSFFILTKDTPKCCCYKIIVSVAFVIIFLYPFVLIFIVVVHAFFLGSYITSHSLEAIVLAFVGGLMAPILFNPAYKKAKALIEATGYSAIN